MTVCDGVVAGSKYSNGEWIFHAVSEKQVPGCPYLKFCGPCKNTALVPLFSGNMGSCGRSGVISFYGTSNFINNWGGSGGAIQIIDNNVLSFSGTSNFINNSAVYGGGAIATSSNCTLTFKGTINFTNNTVSGNGGGLYMKYKSTFFIYPNTTIHCKKNHAQLGGAIFVHDASPISYCTSVAPFVPQEKCFFQLSGHNLAPGSDIQLVFKNNSADIAGSAIYGGAIDNCKLTGQNLYKSGVVFDMIVKSNDSNYNTTSIISSDPFRLCLCENNLPNCRRFEYKFPSAVISLINKVTKPNFHTRCILVKYFKFLTSVASFVPQEKCCFQLSGHNLAPCSDIQLVFKNNSADIAGSAIYGGAIDNCKLTGQNLYKSGVVFDMIVKSNDSNYNTTSIISSDPFRLCLCENNLPNCRRFEYKFPSAVISLINKVTKPNFHTRCILVKYFKFLWLQLDKEME